MQQLVESRKKFKERLFADAICKLGAYPALADMPPCPTLAEFDSGQCKITSALLEEHKSKIEYEEEPVEKAAPLEPKIEHD